MNIWKTVSRIAFGFGVVFIVFAVLNAFITFVAITMQGEFVPATYVQINLVNAMLPYLLYGVLSLIVATVINRSAKEPQLEKAAEMSTQEETATEAPIEEE